MTLVQLNMLHYHHLRGFQLLFSFANQSHLLCSTNMLQSSDKNSHPVPRTRSGDLELILFTVFCVLELQPQSPTAGKLKSAKAYFAPNAPKIARPKML